RAARAAAAAGDRYRPGLAVAAARPSGAVAPLGRWVARARIACPRSGGGLAAGDELREQLDQMLLHGLLRHAEAADRPIAVLLLEQGEQQVLGADVVVTEPQRLTEGQFEHLPGVGGVGDQGGL